MEDVINPLHGRQDVLFLDVREPGEVAASGKIAGALAIPRGLDKALPREF